MKKLSTLYHSIHLFVSFNVTISSTLNTFAVLVNEDIVFTTDLCYCSILCTMASAAWNLFSRQNTVHWISPLVPHRLHLQAAIHLDLLPISLAAVEIDFQCHQDWIEFISVPMGRIDTKKSCRWKSGISWACCQSLLPLMKLIFNFIENLIDFTSIAMGIDKNLSLKSGNGLGSVHSMGKQTMHVSLNVFILEWKVALGEQYLVVKVLLAWFDDQRLASWEKLKFLCLCDLMF